MTEDQEFMEQLRKDFLDETSFLLDQCEESYLNLDRSEARKEELDKIFRLAHSMKGAGAAVGFTDLAEFAHKVEDCLAVLRVYPERTDTAIISLLLRCGDAFKQKISALRTGATILWPPEGLANEVITTFKALQSGNIAASKTDSAAPAEVIPSCVVEAPPEQATLAVVAPVVAPAASTPPTNTAIPTPANNQRETQSVKIDTDRIDNVLDLVGELVVIKSQLINECASQTDNQRLDSIVALLDKTVRELQDRALSMRLTPLKPVFLKTQRIIRDLSVKLDKNVEFTMSGEDTEIDRTMVELLTDPLMHIARNALDHGIEKKEKRLAAGKSETGRISISAKQAGGRIQIIISDDGAGISRSRVIAKAQENGLLAPNTDTSALKDADVYQLLFEPGFSTAEKITDVSGRGVGMDVVKTNIERIKGTIDIDSVEGKGSNFRISIPLTTSISDGMLVEVESVPFVVPMDYICELVDMKNIETIQLHNGGMVIPIRGKTIPLIMLDSLFGEDSAEVLASVGFETSGDRNVRDGSRRMAVIVEGPAGLVAIGVGSVLGQIQVVLKPISPSLKASEGVSGAAILGDGKVALVADIAGLLREQFRGKSA